MSDCLRCGSTVWVPEGNEFSDGDICYSCMEAENQRLMDLVRYQRSELHEAGLISNEEYAALVADSDSGQRVARLEGYDKLRKENSALKEQLAEARKLAQWTPITPENLPTDADEVYCSKTGQTRSTDQGARNPIMPADAWAVWGWTHFRPITPPQEAPRG